MDVDIYTETIINDSEDVIVIHKIIATRLFLSYSCSELMVPKDVIRYRLHSDVFLYAIWM